MLCFRVQFFINVLAVISLSCAVARPVLLSCFLKFMLAQLLAGNRMNLSDLAISNTFDACPHWLVAREGLKPRAYRKPAGKQHQAMRNPQLFLFVTVANKSQSCIQYRTYI